MFWLLNSRNNWETLFSKKQLFDGLNVIGYGSNEYSIERLLSISVNNGEIDSIPSLVLSGIELEKALRFLTAFGWGARRELENDCDFFVEFCPDNGWRKLCLSSLLTRQKEGDSYHVSSCTEDLKRFEFYIRAVDNVVVEVLDFCVPNGVAWDSVAKILGTFGWTYKVSKDEPVWFKRINCVGQKEG